MIWLGWAWAVVYAILIAITILLYAAFGDWPWGVLAFLPLVPYAIALRSLRRAGRQRRPALRALLLVSTALMIAAIFRWQVIDALIRRG